MGRAMRVIVIGSRKVGKTAILRQVACMEDITKQVSFSPFFTHNILLFFIFIAKQTLQEYNPTLEDTYQVVLEEVDRPREILIFHDTAGIPEYGPIELKRAYIQVLLEFVVI